MSGDESTWVVDRAVLVDAMELTPGERAHFEKAADQVLAAIVELIPPASIETPDVRSGPSSGAHLLLPRTRYHLNVTAAAKAALLPALQIVARAFVLDRANLIESGLTFTATSIHTLLTGLTRLTDDQLQAVTAILDIVRAKKLPNYRASTSEIGKRLKWKAAQVDTALRPIVNKVVDYEPGTKSWRVIF